MTLLVAGTRGSALALWQTRHVAALLRERVKAEVTERIITTEGDVSKVERLAGALEKGFFTKEIEAELLAGSIHLAVHSLKDLPTRLTDGLVLPAVLERADAFDLLIAQPDAVVDVTSARLPLRAGAKVGTSSLRREALLAAFAPEVQTLPLRGNVPTRIDKLRSKQYDAVVMAAAGVRRLQIPLDGLMVFELEPRRWPPAPGQGSVAVESRAGDSATFQLLHKLNHPTSEWACTLERAVLRELEGGCTTPFGCFVDGSYAWLGRAGLDGVTAPWRAARVPLPGPRRDATNIPSFVSLALDALDASRHADPIAFLAARPGADAIDRFTAVSAPPNGTPDDLDKQFPLVRPAPQVRGSV
jgi:hydroxymethylbilane synthase